MSPAVSKSQFKLMKAIAEGVYPSGYRGISKKVAKEFVRKTKNVKSLPKKVKSKKK